MLRGVYLSATGMSAEKKYLDIVSNNITNANTPGFRAKRASLSHFGQEMIRRLKGGQGTPVGTVDQGPALQDTSLAADSGSLEFTGRPLDIATRDANVFLEVEAAEGTAYTRGGSLFVDDAHYIVDAQGNRVTGQNGAIQLPAKTTHDQVRIGTNGEVSVGEKVVATLQLVELDANGADWSPTGLVRAAQGTVTPLGDLEGAVVTGAVEQANVDIVRELNELIRASRLYQVNQQTLKVQDEAVQKAVSTVGELS